MSRVTDLQGYLRSLDAETLAELLHEQAARDPELLARLQLRATATGAELTEVHTMLDHAEPGRASFGEAAKIGAVLDTLQRLLDSGTQADVAPLARRSVDRITEALRQMDDSSGAVGAELRRALGLYARACAAHPPEPEPLAEWILGAVLDGRVEIELAEFAKALGGKGLRRIKSIVDEVLARPGTEARRQAAERLDEQLAEISGDVDALLAILSRRPPRLDVSLKIVRVLRAAGRTTEAVAHAAKALSQDKGPARAPVVDELAETYQETGRSDEAVKLRRAEFDRAPALDTFLALREAAVEPGLWDAEPALKVMAERATTDEFVRALLAEDRPDEAWQAALRLGCSLPVLLDLAELREVRYPADVLVVYRSHIEELIEQKDAAHYEQAAKVLRKLRTLYRRAGVPAEFAPYLAELVRTHRRKARLLAEIRKARIALPKV
ncbi:DUF6880 family protein [Amycolatopsis sp.]|uniref:DUF6880 family protein n=1 Tax=Amycolatopsis sp. TaxID=37632 RepID=UPI002C584417|nr:DUF6880 family protein [Amycolatopsis sp.]HVV13556.1 hypothetical protein [Amycolatopsis sp.]